MAKEVLMKIKEAEENNKARMKEAKQEVLAYKVSAERSIQEEKKKQQDKIKLLIDQKVAELGAKLQEQKNSLSSNEQEAQQFFEQLYHQNKEQALQLVLQKVRENYGS